MLKNSISQVIYSLLFLEVLLLSLSLKDLRLFIFLEQEMTMEKHLPFYLQKTETIIGAEYY